MEFKREGQKFSCQGMQLTRPVDLLAEHKYAILRNVRAYTDGTIHPRLGLAGVTTMGSGSGVAHSLKRYFDPISSTTMEFVGRGTDLFRATTAVASGFSGNPLSFITARPFSSLEPYLYASDTNKMVKVDKSGTVTNVGIATPTGAVSTALGGPSYTALESFESAPNGWTNGGTAGAIALMAAKRVNTTITYILYDSGSTGWASISPAATDVGIQPGAILQLAATEAARVEKVFSPITATTIGSISYDSGSTGLCTIQLTSTPLEGLERDAIVRLAAAENVRILSVTTGPDSVPSFRCSTTATRAAGDAVAGLTSFRAYLTTTRAAADTITGEAFETSVTEGIGYLTKVAAFNLSTISNRPISPDDEIHLSVRLDAVAQLTEGKVMFNVDTSTTFDKNYAYFPFTANSLTPAVDNTLTTRSVQQTLIQQQQITDSLDPNQTLRDSSTRQYQLFLEYDNGSTPIITPEFISPLPPPGETATGDSQWTELVFKVKDLTWVGSDQSKSLASINAIRLQVNVLATTVVDFDSLWIGGTYGLESGVFPYIWTYCYVNKGAGIRSNPAPPMRAGIEAKRERVVLTPSYSADAQVDQIEFYRYGGTLPEWHYVGAGLNSGTFTDTYPDEEISNNFGLEFDNFQPFPVADASRSGTCDVNGTEVTRVSGDTFNIAWLRGSEVVIDGVPTNLYTNPSSTTKLSLEDSLGTKTGVTFHLKSPTLGGQTMTSMWGPYTIAGLNFNFGCKLGTLYFTKANNPDCAPESYMLEVTSPNEPLIGGCIYDGQSYVFSTERMFRVIPALSATTMFEIQEVPVGKGLMAPHALAVDDLIYFVSRDGLYQTNGQEVKNISDPDLYPLFPHDGQAGVTTNGLAPPDFAQTSVMQVAAGDGLVKFTFKDTGAVYRTLVYDTRIKGWFFDTYTPTVVCHYWDEGGANSSTSITTRERVGGSDGKVYTANSGITDNGTAITSQVRTRSWDAGDSRAQKLFGDLMLDHVGTVSVTPGFNNYATTLGTTSPVQATRSQSLIDLTSGAGQKAKNIALNLSFTDSAVVLYEWQPSFVVRPEDSKLRWLDYTDDGSLEPKWLQGIHITTDTEGVTRTIQVQGDDGVVVGTLTVNHNGLSTKDYPSTGDTWTPQYTHMMRLVPTDSGSWQTPEVKWVWEAGPPSATRWESQGTAHEQQDFHHLRRAWVALLSNADVTFTLTADGVDYTYTLASTGGARRKVLVPLQAVKAKLWVYKFTSTLPFRLYMNDSAVEVHGWGQQGPYKDQRPFGAVHYYNGPAATQARI